MTMTLEPPTRFDQERIPAASRESRVSALARRALDHSPYRMVSLLECQVVDGVIVLSGSVTSFYLKQLAQEVLMRLDSGNRIDNRVEVIPGWAGGGCRER